MSEYRQPETRIKRVKDGQGQRYYAQYKMVLIPYILWEWYDTAPFVSCGYTNSLVEAKDWVDKFLVKDKQRWDFYRQKSARSKIKKEVEYIKYP